MQPRLLKHPARLAGASLLRLQDDARLVALAREGHDPAFAAIVDRYGRQLERYCARLLGPGRAEDAVQQAFVNAHAAMRANDQELALKPWLYRIAHNAALNILRASPDENGALDADRPSVFLTPEIVELRERLRETLASIQALPAVQRDALLLRELEGRSHEEIAAALGVTEGGARQHLHRARVALRTAASAVTPYPVLARVLSAAAAEGGRGADLVSGAGLGAGAGAMKIAAGVLAAGAIAGGAVGVNGHHAASARTGAAGRTHSATALSEANDPSAAPLEVADNLSAGATASHGRRRDHGGARGHGPGRGHRGGDDHSSSGPDRRSGGHGSDDPVGSEDHRGTSGGGTGSSDGGSGKSGSSGSGSSGSDSGSSGSGSGSSGSGSSGSGSGDTTTEASPQEPATTTDGGGSSGSGSSDGGLLTTTSSSDGHGGDQLSGSGSGETTTDGH
jgi:RNA polymerase sigma factor (sigma-70 family)